MTKMQKRKLNFTLKTYSKIRKAIHNNVHDDHVPNVAHRMYSSLCVILQRTYNVRKKIYKIFFDNKLIGMTKLEFGDPQMGVVFGQINFTENNIGYDFIKKYCIDNLIEILTDYPTDKLITTGKIEKLKIYNTENIELVGLGNIIDGMDSDIYTITILGLESEVYEKNFPQHIAEYELKFNR
jgi:hypothetical protein